MESIVDAWQCPDQAVRRLGATLRAMARTLNGDTFGPPGVCDACGRPCCGLEQVGITCYHCKAGTFMSRHFWRYTYLDGDLIATPREDVTEADVRDASLVSCARP